MASPDSALAETLARLGGVPLRLEEVTQAALQNSAQAREATAALAAARGELRRERGVFDPALFAEGSKASDRQPSASPFTGAAVLHPSTTSGAAGARITLPIGTELQASVTAQKLETNSTFASLNPQYDAAGSLTVRQPLLQGFGPAAWGKYLQTRFSFKAAEARYADAVAGIRATAEEVYWDLYAAERDLAVAMLIREQATALLGEANLRAGVGLVGPNQVNTAKVFLAQQQLMVFDAEDNLERQSDVLASLIGRRPTGEATRFHTTDTPPHFASQEATDSVLARALRSNAALEAARLDVERARREYQAAKWNALPQADLLAALGGNGLSGTGRDVIFGTDTLRNSLNTTFSDALDQALQRDYPSWMIGFRITIPILLREKGGERDRLRAELARAEARFVQARHTLEEQVLAVHRELQKGQDRLTSAEAGVRAARDQVRIGRIEYDSGTTTAFELVRLGADLANAERSYSLAQVRTAKAAARLRQLAPEAALP